MNKIIIDKKEYNLELKEDIYLDIKNNSTINIQVNNINNKLIILAKNKKIQVNFEIVDNNYLEINSLGINSSINYNINMNRNNNLVLVSSIISNIDSVNNINIINNYENNNSYVSMNGINLSSNKLYFNINGIVKKESIDCNLNEYSKIINISDGDSKIIPNLIVDTKEVIANHSAFIGAFSNLDLYYLMSRGISLENSKKLLIKTILFSNMKCKDVFIEEIDNLLNRG